MPSDINGLLKSITRSLSDVIVIEAIAISASCWHEIRSQHSTKYVRIWREFCFSKRLDYPIYAPLTLRTNSPTIPSQPPLASGFSEPYWPSLTIRSSSAKEEGSFSCMNGNCWVKLTVNSQFGRHQFGQVLAVTFKLFMGIVC